MIRSSYGILQNSKVLQNWVNFGMNPRILLQIKSVCGVVERDCMLVFDEGCIRSDIWMKVQEKWEKIPILGSFR